MPTYRGVIIEESLGNKDVLKRMKILSTKAEKVTEKHKTPWVSRWTMHTVEMPEDTADEVAEEIAKALDRKHPWYADFKNKTRHYIIFRDRFFCIDRKNQQQYDEAKLYGISLGIPEYQLDFVPEDTVWERELI